MAAITRIPYARKELYQCEPQPTYTGRNLDEIAFPLGGIGTGMISLGGWGQLRDWEIMNRPAKGFNVPQTFFTLKIQTGKQPPVVKVVQGPVGGSYAGGHSSVPWDIGTGLPHFRQVSFTGEFPLATVRFQDPDMPVEVTLEAFNPFIPLNDKDSGIPVAILLYRLKNTSKQPVSAMLFGNLTNMVGHPDGEGRVNQSKASQGIKGLYLTTSEYSPSSPQFGSLALATTWKDTVSWPRWKEGGHGGLAKFWEAIAWSDKFPPAGKGSSDTGTVAARCKIKPGETITIPFFIAWHFPNFEHWAGKMPRATWKNYYASFWGDAWEVAAYTARNLERLEQETRLFHDTLFASTLPTHVLDAVSSQISILKTPTCLRLEDGTFYGFEGCSDCSGCCEGSCTHVWNYAQALPYLFPALQRSMSEAHYANDLLGDGYMCFRMPLPLGTKGGRSFHPAADGQMGMVMQVYREWLISGDDDWLRKMWPKARKALEFAWKYWDADRDGVMEGMQHNTYDMEFHGPNTVMGSLYLGALRAAEEMALHLGKEDKARQYRNLFQRGSAWTDKHLFNGEYYEQKVNPAAAAIWPERQRELSERHGKDDKFPTWPKWQFGKGCTSDQMIGQWYGMMLGLGHLYDRRKVRRALQSVFKYNWRADLSDHPCLLRVYAFNDEAGLIVGTWPKGGRPGHAFWFADEVWCGMEYQVAAHLIYEGLVDEGLAIVMGTRRRHTGDQRNPWDEFECGHHYSRSMSSYSVLLALSGFSYSAPEGRIGFAPKIFQHDFRTFFSVASGWGLYSQKVSASSAGSARKAELSLSLNYGSLTLNKLTTSLPTSKVRKATANMGRKQIGVQVKREKGSVALFFDSPVVIEQGQTLKIRLA